MTDKKIDEIEELLPENDDAIRTEVVTKIQAILDEYGYVLGVAGFIVTKK